MDATDANDSNTHSIRLKLALDEVAEIVSATAADPTSVLSKLTLQVVADGYHAFDFAWPFPLDFHVDMRLGTHTLEARLMSFDNNGDTVDATRPEGCVSSM